MSDFESTKLRHDGIEAALMMSFAACPRSRTTAQMDSKTNIGEIRDDLIVHVDCKVGRLVRILVTRSDGRVNKQAEMWIVDLND